uniref:Zinc finger, CCHC-type n=1 Tax=Tanacetum cinerariifolium TaxID=118510 RepID=A0A699J041_TANCI|nr:zinc finger, CCHC-type [Tanacetum cinerariifolium]
MLFKTRSLDYLSSSKFNLIFDPEDQFEEEETEIMGEPTMEEYMTKTREGYGLGIARPEIDEKAYGADQEDGKLENNDYVCRGLILNDFNHTLKHKKEQLTLVDLGSHMHIKQSLTMQDNDKPKGNNVSGPSVVNMVEHNNSNRYNDNKSKRKHHDTNTDPHKKFKLTFWKCRKPRHLKKDCKGGKLATKPMI